MAITRTLANSLLYEMGLGNVNFGTNHFRVILMAADFVFDRNLHVTYADIFADELPAGGGYLSGGKELLIARAWEQNNDTGGASIAWQDVEWSAGPGGIGPFISGIVLSYNDTTPNDSMIVGEVRLGTAITATDGISFFLVEPGFDLQGA